MGSNHAVDANAQAKLPEEIKAFGQTVLVLQGGGALGAVLGQYWYLEMWNRLYLFVGTWAQLRKIRNWRRLFLLKWGFVPLKEVFGPLSLTPN